MARDRSLEEIRRENDRRWMANALETARTFIKPMSRAERVRRYGSGGVGVGEGLDGCADFRDVKNS